MLKDSDIKDFFSNYTLTPPEKVWRNVAYALSMQEKVSTPRPFFSTGQKLVLAVASLSSIFLCGFILRYSEEEPMKVVSVKKYEKNESESILASNQSSFSAIRKSYAQSNRTPNYIVSNRKLPIRVNNEYKAYEKELMTLAELDRQIARLGEEIAELKQTEMNTAIWDLTQESNYHSDIRSLQDLVTDSDKDQVVISNQEQVLLKSEEPYEELSKPIVKEPKTSIWDRVYITPYMGTNISNISYQDKPAHNFFSEKAQFSPSLGYNAGVQFGIQLSKRWGIESGIGLGQYILGFNENYGTHLRDGHMYIDQLDFPLLMRFTMPLKKAKLPINLSLKAGLIYSSVIFYQVNYSDKYMQINPIGPREQSFQFNVDKSQYNSMQFGYAGGLDLDAFLSKKLALNLSMLNALVSQVSNFPFFSSEKRRPVQFSSSFSIGTKITF